MGLEILEEEVDHGLDGLGDKSPPLVVAVGKIADGELGQVLVPNSDKDLGHELVAAPLKDAQKETVAGYPIGGELADQDLTRLLILDSPDGVVPFVTCQMVSIAQAGGIWQQNVSGRRHNRLFFRLKAIVRTVQRRNGRWVLGPMEQVVVHNISRSGIGFISSRKFVPDENIYIGTRKGAADQAIIFKAVVVRCVTHIGGWYTIGARLHDEVSEEFVESFINLFNSST